MCMHEMYNRVRTGKHLSDTFPVHSGIKDRNSCHRWFSILFNKISGKGNRTRNGLTQVLVFYDDQNMLGII
jgi:hypothetical protein